MGAVFLKADDSLEATKAEAQEKFDENCKFDKFPEGIRLRPIYFISRSTVSPLEKSGYSFVGESVAVMWDKGKSRQYLWGAEFTLISDCSGLQKLFEQEGNVPHMVHRRQSELLQY